MHSYRVEKYFACAIRAELAGAFALPLALVFCFANLSNSKLSMGRWPLTMPGSSWRRRATMAGQIQHVCKF